MLGTRTLQSEYHGDMLNTSAPGQTYIERGQKHGPRPA